MEAFLIIFGIIIVGLIVFARAKGSGSRGTPYRPKIEKGSGSRGTPYSDSIEKIGEHGENFVARILSSDPNSVVFNDITLIDENTKKSSQIDHIVVRKNGVFVVETKNYAGRVYGSDSQREWTQVLAYGETKNRFYNPVKQNSTHIYFLAKVLKQHNIYISVVVFPRADLYVQSDTFVCNGEYSLLKALSSNTGISLTAEQIRNIATRLAGIKANPQITKEEHIQSIHKMQYEIASNICPRCGKPLTLRKGKNGSFYGCSGYPSCRFTKNI